MKKSLLILFICFNTISYAQSTIQGKVIDSETKSELPYVNIGIPGTKIGTVSNQTGNFKLYKVEGVSQLNDSLTFSYIGYKSEIIPISDFSEGNIQIEMTPEVSQLEEVVLGNKRPKRKSIGRDHKGTGTMWYNFYTAGEKQDDRLGKEMGMKFGLKGDYRVKSLNFYIGNNEYNSVKFRMNIYRVEDNIPVELINKENIVFEVGSINSDWYILNLDDYNIYLEKELGEIAVTIQWLESEKKTPKSKFFSIPAGINPLDTLFSREKGMAQWNSASRNLSFYLEVDQY